MKEAINLYATDFMYDDQLLSDYHFIVCSFDAGSGAEVADTGAQITFDKVPMMNGKRYSTAGVKYEECYSTTIQICKDPEWFEDPDDKYITDDEFAEMARWLNRKKFLRFMPINDEDPDGRLINFYASFTVSKIKVGEKCCGIELGMETNSPFAFGDTETKIYVFTSKKLTDTLEDISDEVGFVYPKVDILCKQDGELRISSDLGRCQSVIQNCSNGETITMSGISKIISTNKSDHDVSDDFNYDFFRIGNTIDNRVNTITVNMPCTVGIEYEPVLKVTL